MKKGITISIVVILKYDLGHGEINYFNNLFIRFFFISNTKF